MPHGEDIHSRATENVRYHHYLDLLACWCGRVGSDPFDEGSMLPIMLRANSSTICMASLNGRKSTSLIFPFEVRHSRHTINRFHRCKYHLADDIKFGTMSLSPSVYRTRRLDLKASIAPTKEFIIQTIFRLKSWMAWILNLGRNGMTFLVCKNHTRRDKRRD